MTFLDRFTETCRADGRVVAAWLGGAHARGTADVYSDVDLGLITTDADFAAFIACKEEFIGGLGRPLLLEDWGRPGFCWFILADGTEGELVMVPAQQLATTTIHSGPFVALVDKQGILAGVEFPEYSTEPAAQVRFLRSQLLGFWHEMAHFSKALARAQPWFAYGSLEAMRQICANLARLRVDFADAGAGAEPYFKVDEAMPVAELAPLLPSFCAPELPALAAAGLVLVDYYREAATELAAAHGLAYPAELERLLLARLDAAGVRAS